MADEKKSLFLNFMKQILADKRYWLLLIIFILLLVYGQNIAPNNEVDKTLKNIGLPEIERNSLVYESRDILSSKQGERYHIVFQIKAENIQRTDQSSEEIRLSLTDNLGNQKVISNLSIQTNTDYFTNEDLKFKTDNGYKNLSFEKVNTSSQSAIFIKNIHLVRLEGNREISPSLIGSFDNSRPEELFGYQEAKSILASSNKGSRKVGETFVASSNYILGVKMKLHFRGNGGNGDYQIAIKKIEDGKVNDQKITQLNFSSATAMALYRVDGVNEIYFIPISASLIPGQKYLLELNSDNVRANFFHNLQILGKNNNSNSDLEIKGHYGNFYTRYYFAEKSTYNNRKTNFGDTFSDLGNGTGEYVYDISSKYSSLDIFESGDDFITYKIDTFFPFKILYIEAGFAEKETDSFLYYSYDNKNWNLLEKNGNLANQYQKQIMGAGKQEILYIKSISQNQDKSSPTFNSLKVSASVNITN